MGHWAQYRKRGGNRPGTRNDNPPPAPVIVLHGDGLQIQPGGGNDVGGTFEVYKGAVVGGPFPLAVIVDWGNPVNLSLAELTGTGFFIVLERGNGEDYVNAGDPSNELHVV